MFVECSAADGLYGRTDTTWTSQHDVVPTARMNLHQMEPPLSCGQSNMDGGGLLIRGFGVRVPGGAQLIKALARENVPDRSLFMSTVVAGVLACPPDGAIIQETARERCHSPRTAQDLRGPIGPGSVSGRS